MQPLPRQPLIKVAFIGSACIYVVVAWFLAGQAPAGPAPTLDIGLMTTILGAVYALTVVVAPLIVRRFPPGSNSQMLVALALYESGALYGLLLSILSHQVQYALYFGTASVVLMLLLA